MKYTTLNYTNKNLKKLLEDNNIESRATSMVERYLQLFDANILKREEVFPPKVKRKVGRPPKEEGKLATKPKRDYFSRPTRTHPRKVIYTDIETGEVFTYDSTPCPRKKQATLIFDITSPSVEIFLQFLKHLVQE